MNITAARLGTTKILFDWTGFPLKEHPQQNKVWDKTLESLKNKRSGFYLAAIDPHLSQIEESIQLAEKIKSNPHITDCVFLGIGGSSLGPIALLEALKHKQSQKIQVHFFENPDPIDWNYRISKLNPKNTLVVVVTKSGTTYETVALFMLAFDWLKKVLGHEQAIQQTVAITDPKAGELRALCHQLQLDNLIIDPSTGGRFSVFTPVGLFVAALTGLDVRAFLQGAKKVYEYCEKTLGDEQALQKNIFSKIASLILAHEKSHPIHVLMPYSTSLKLLSSWWVQLWAESLGKNGQGFTPLATLGAVDQHSILQLLRDGPNDKLIGFIQLDDFKTPTKIPTLELPHGVFNEQTFQLLAGQDLGQLLNIEGESIYKVMVNQKRPSFRIKLDELSEEGMGSLMYYFCVLTAYMGDLMEINPFDQPGVEEGKVYIREKLGNQKLAQ